MFVCYTEIYKENLYDLLADKKIRRGGHGVYQPVTNIFQALNYLKSGEKKRRKASTGLNAQTSRSHTVFEILLTNSLGRVEKSSFKFVELAGSENLSESTSSNFKEVISCIHKDLLSLGRVLMKLGSNKNQHVPYRDSQLTYMLKGKEKLK